MASSKVRDQRLDAAKRVVEPAKRFGAEFLLIASDLFEDNAVDRVLVRRVAEIIAGHHGADRVVNSRRVFAMTHQFSRKILRVV